MPKVPPSKVNWTLNIIVTVILRGIGIAAVVAAEAAQLMMP